jgi:hypothetical protein
MQFDLGIFYFVFFSRVYDCGEIQRGPTGQTGRTVPKEGVNRFYCSGLSEDES